MKKLARITLLAVAMTVAACGGDEAAPEAEGGAAGAVEDVAQEAEDTMSEDQTQDEGAVPGVEGAPEDAMAEPAPDAVDLMARLGDDPEETAEGLRYTDLVEGEGAEATSGSQVTVHYTGTFEDGSKFDSSLDRGTPFPFVLGAGQVIQGWDLGVAGMKVGGKRVMWIPSELAYGESGFPGAIPPNSPLLFEVELLDVQ